MTFIRDKISKMRVKRRRPRQRQKRFYFCGLKPNPQLLYGDGKRAQRLSDFPSFPISQNHPRKTHISNYKQPKADDENFNFSFCLIRIRSV